MKIIHTHDRAHEGWALMLIAVLLLVGFTAIITAGLVEATRSIMPNDGTANASTNTVVRLFTSVVTNRCPCGCQMVIGGGAHDCGCGGQMAPATAEPRLTTTFTLQYGVDDLGRPWVAAGRALPENAQPAQPVVTLGAVIATRTGYALPLYLADGTVWIQTYDLNFNAVDCAPAGAWTPPNPAGMTVILQRADQLGAAWLPIYTNTVLPGGVWTYTDEDAWIQSGFYQLQSF